MPFTHVAIPAGTPPADKAAIARGVHEAMVATLGIPDDDFFQMVCEYQPGDFLFDRGFLGVQRSDRVVVIRITLRRGRSDAMKRDLYARVAANLGRSVSVAGFLWHPAASGCHLRHAGTHHRDRHDHGISCGPEGHRHRCDP